MEHGEGMILSEGMIHGEGMILGEGMIHGEGMILGHTWKGTKSYCNAHLAFFVGADLTDTTGDRHHQKA